MRLGPSPGCRPRPWPSFEPRPSPPSPRSLYMCLSILYEAVANKYNFWGNAYKHSEKRVSETLALPLSLSAQLLGGCLQAGKRVSEPRRRPPPRMLPVVFPSGMEVALVSAFPHVVLLCGRVQTSRVGPGRMSALLGAGWTEHLVSFVTQHCTGVGGKEERGLCPPPFPRKKKADFLAGSSAYLRRPLLKRRI